jgi:hypothetical protein
MWKCREPPWRQRASLPQFGLDKALALREFRRAGGFFSRWQSFSRMFLVRDKMTES